MEHDHDVVVIGSGFGGSVAALRLAEKGYRVHVYEAGRRYEDDDFAESSWNLPKYFWMPWVGCYGIQRVHRLPDCLVLAGAGVGGGSLNYANTLYVPPTPFFRDRQWAHITDWEAELAPHYATAQRMLGVVTNTCDGPVEQMMRATADDLGVGDTFRRTPVGVFFGEPGKRVPDPYFGGDGPERTGCTQCGNCMVGCRVGAKNTLMKNYLALAERRGVTIEPMRTVRSVRPLDPDSPESGYAVTTAHTGPWGRRRWSTVTTGQVVVAAGAWGSAKLLHALKDGPLPRISDQLGVLTRTNSESLSGVVLDRVPAGQDLTRGIAITTSFNIDDSTHIENCRYGRGSNASGLMDVMAVPSEGKGPRWVRFVAAAARHPLELARSVSKRRWSERTIIALVMQTHDNSITVRRRKWPVGSTLTSTQGTGEPNPTHIPEAIPAVTGLARRLEALTGGRARLRSSIGEVLDIPMTAHFLGGAVISDTPETGVVDPYHRLWGYPGIHVVDGSAVSANLGVNPSLTITAQAERAFSLWPARGEVDRRPTQGDAYVRLDADPPSRSRERSVTPAT
jgi:cholesterol oxidase